MENPEGEKEVWEKKGKAESDDTQDGWGGEGADLEKNVMEGCRESDRSDSCGPRNGATDEGVSIERKKSTGCKPGGGVCHH